MNGLQDIDRRLFLKYFCAAATTTAFIGSGLETKAFPHSEYKRDDPATHGMLIFGEKTVFLSHLPMFQSLNSDRTAYMTPHRYQVILEASFQNDTGNLQDIYINDKLENQDVKIYTLNPTPFILPNLNPKNSNPPPSNSFKATISRGHFEKGGEEIEGLKDIEVKINRVIHFRMFNPQVSKPSQLKYILLGNPQELFLAHYITAPPDFDQVLSVKVSNHTFTSEELSKGIELIIPNKSDDISERIKEGQDIKAQTECAQALPLAIKAEKEIYFEEGELLIPPTFRDTETEKNSTPE